MYEQSSGSGRGSNRRSYNNSYLPGSRNDHGEGSTSRSMGEQPYPASDEDERDEQSDINVQPTPQTSQEPQYSGAYVVIPPNQAKRDKLLRMSTKELEEYERYREAKRPGPVNLTPKKLGGQTTESEARRQQQQSQSQSKYQKMLQREDYKRKLREQEEAEIQQKKDIQRQKAEKLEETRRQQDMERRQRWHKDMTTRNNDFLDRLSLENNYPTHNRYGNTPSARGKSQAVKQEWTPQNKTEMDNWDELQFTAAEQEQDEDWISRLELKESIQMAATQEQDEDWILQKVLKESIEMHKAEEERRLQEMKEAQHTQSRSHAVKQDLDEEEWSMQHTHKEEKSWKNVKQEQDKDIWNLQQKVETLDCTERTYHRPPQQSYKQQQKEEEERRLKQIKEEQRRKSELLGQGEEERRESQQEERRRVNSAFLDRLQRQNTSQHEYLGDSNAWA